MIKVLFFAQLAELAGEEFTHVEYKTGLTPTALVKALADNYSIELIGALEDEATIVAVNQQVVERDLLLKPGDELAFLPPFSGG